MTKRRPLEEEIGPPLREAFRMVSERDLHEAVPLSLLCVDRLIGLGHALRAATAVPGDTAEIGAAAGGTSRLMALANRGRRHWACDTFAGLVDVGPVDVGLKNGMFARPRTTPAQAQARVRRLLAGLNACTVRGVFPASAPAEMREARFSLVHIDVDTYASMRAAFEFFSQRMAPGGLVALDDVLFSGAPGAQLFWRELVECRQSRAWEVFSRVAQQVIVRFH